MIYIHPHLPQLKQLWKADCVITNVDFIQDNRSFGSNDKMHY